tara:strand:+ start:52 stop:231 length:180 start_codon:yes stop_codon:yes gene_type:complete
MRSSEVTKLRTAIDNMQNSNDSIKEKINEINKNIQKLLETVESKENKKENNLFKLCFCT